MRSWIAATGVVLLVISPLSQAQHVAVRVGTNSKITFLATAIPSPGSSTPYVFPPGSQQVISVPAGGKLKLLSDPQRNDPETGALLGINGNISAIVDLAAPRTYVSCRNKASSGKTPVLRIAYIATDGTVAGRKECKPGDATQQTIDVPAAPNAVIIEIFDPDADTGF